MAGIYSQGGSAGHRYAGWLSEVEAKNFQFGGKVFNGSPSAIYVGSNLVWIGWLRDATKQAIMVAFGADGAAVIRATNAYLNGIAATDQSKAQQIADWLNVYVLEDAKIVYSLVEGIGWRRINSDGSHHIDTGYKPNQNTRVVVEICRNQQVNASGWDFPYGVGMYTQSYRMYICFYSNYFQIFAGQSNTDASYPATITDGQKYVVDESHVNSYIDGNLVATRTTQATASPVNMWIGTCNYNNGNNGVAKAGFGNFKIYDDGELVRHFVPFIRENKVGMLDLLTDTFYQDNGNQSFTISETPWTPPTP